MNFIYKKIYHPNAKQIDYEFDKNGKINFEEITKNIIPNTCSQMLLIESPSGFTGQGINKEEFERILTFCQEKHILLVVDETYLETRQYSWSAIDFINQFKNLIVVRSFSKAYGIAGLRAGIVISHQDNIKVMSAVKPMHEISSFTKYVIDQILTDSSLLNYRDQIELDENNFFSILNEKNTFRVKKTRTNFILFNSSNFSCEFIHDRLLANNIKVKIHKDVKYFGKWCSASLGNSENNNLITKTLLNFL